MKKFTKKQPPHRLKKTTPRTELKNGRIAYVWQFTVGGKRKRRYFNSAQEMEAAQNAQIVLEKSVIKNVASADFSSELLLDIGNALKILPKGKTLVECVRIASESLVPNKSLDLCVKEFIDTKKNISKHQQKQARSRVERYFNYIGNSFDKVNSESVLQFLKDLQRAEKTKKHYATTLKEFFYWLEVKGYFKRNPFKQIHRSDMPKPKKAKRDRVPINLIADFFAELEEKLPHLAGICALAAFGGVRIGEAQKIRSDAIDFKRKEITIDFDISKTGKLSGQNYLQAEMPNNLWNWIEKYPVKIYKGDMYEEFKNIASWSVLPDNALRHAFATYHLSLFRSPSKTAMLMRHEDERRLWNDYLDRLCGSDIAKEYFEIVPKL